MTVSTTDSVIEYVSGGPAFPIPYRFLQNSDIQAILVKQDGTSETLVLGTQYTLAGAGTQSGGTLTSAYAAGFLASPGATLSILRSMIPVQPTDLRNQGRFLAETHETVFDRLTLLIQQLLSITDRSLAIPYGRNYYDAKGRQIKNVGTPTDPSDAATKQYVDNSTQGSMSYTDAQIQRTVRGQPGEVLTPLPGVSSRTGRLLSFDGAGNPIAVAPESGSAIDLAIALADAFDPSRGAGMIGYKGSTVRDTLNSLAVPVTRFGAVGTSDDTLVLQAAIDSGAPAISIPPDAVVTVGTVRINRDISLLGYGAGSVIRRKANYELDNSSAVGPLTTMIDVISHDIKVRIQGICLDGNEANQNVATPSGSLIRAANIPGGSGKLLSINVDNCVLVNSTRAGIFVAGDATLPGEEILTVTNCLFLNGRPGIAGGDPRAVNPSGFAPAYINVGDGFKISISNNVFAYMLPLSTVTPRDYAPNAARITSLFTTSNNGGASATFNSNYFYGLGRSDTGYDGTLNANNGLGVVDCYTIGRDVVVDGNLFMTSRSAPVRAKSSIQRLVVASNVMLDNDEKGVSIGPMGDTVGTQEGRIIIDGNIIEFADVLGIGISGDASVTPNTIGHITVSGNHVFGVRNVNGLVGNVGAISIRNARRVNVSDNTIANSSTQADIRGIQIRDCVDAVVDGNNIANVGNTGIDLNALTGRAVVTSNMVNSCGSAGINVDGSMSPDVIVANNHIDTCVNYGVIVFSGRYVNVEGNIALNVSGNSRGFYVPPTATKALVLGNNTNATTGLFQTLSGNVSQIGNSWNPTRQFRTAAPTTGTWVVGDIVEHPTPGAGEVWGWRCVVAGTPGTWKSMGTLAA